MALRLCNKINRNIVENVRNLLSPCRQCEVTVKAQLSDQHDAEGLSLSSKGANLASQTPSVRYSIPSTRTSSIDRICNYGGYQSERALVHQQTERKTLQPAFMPNYYEVPKMDVQLRLADMESTDAKPAIMQEQQRQFAQSNTQTNVTLPLKIPKLSNPFPDPVKVMWSHQVSDEEKANQMLNEAKMNKKFSTSTATASGNLAAQQQRYYSKKSGGKKEKCKKLDSKRSCPKMTMDCCPPVKNPLTCHKEPKLVNCKKQEAPYPSYSESCYMEPFERYSECKHCYWKEEENPNFKGKVTPPKPNQGYHTMACPPPMLTETVGLLNSSDASKSIQAKKFSTVHPWAQPGPAYPTTIRLNPSPCKGPDRRSCPEKAQAEKERREKCKPLSSAYNPKTQKSTPKKKKTSWAEQVKKWAQLQDSGILVPIKENKLELMDENEWRKPKCKQKEKCIKLPFDPVQRQRETFADKCPKKKKSHNIQDCPPETIDCDKRSLQLDELVMRCEKSKADCPNVDTKVNKDIEEYPNPCRKPKPTGTETCPKDLLKKRRKPDRCKKTKAFIPPPMTQGPSSTYLRT